VCPVAASAASLGNILTLGDSITKGTFPGGYRQRLYNDLVAADYSFHFVGTLATNATPTLATAAQDGHEGHGGYSITRIDAELDTWLGAIDKPDYVLLLIGTNDFTSYYPGPETVIQRLDKLIRHITTDLPDAWLIVSNLTPRTEADVYARIQGEFNPLVQPLVASYAAGGARVSFVDMHSVVGFSDLYDNVHPNQRGDQKMGDAWFGAIVAVPEPSAIVLLGIGAICWLTYAWRRRTA
jgi:lysophospholipase L1-like esterase